MKRIVLFFVITCVVLVSNAQPMDSAGSETVSRSEKFSLPAYCKEHGIFQHLDVSLNLGTTGVGVELSSPVSEMVHLRAGFDFMPHFHHKMSFGVQVGDNEAESDAKFNRLSGLLEDFTGYKVDNKIDMIGVPTFYNFKFLVDVFPIKNNKKWHVTAGFYWGSSQIAKAYNTTEDMPSLMAVSIYNNMYEKVMNYEPLIVVPGMDSQFDDPEIQNQLHDTFSAYGRMGMPVGHFVSDGSTYMMEPGDDGMVKAKARVNAFKPYLGFGYGGRLIKNNDKYHVALDCGLMFWGGTPSIITHDGTDIAKDVTDIKGKVGDYVDFFKGFKVFPVLNVRFVKTLF